MRHLKSNMDRFIDYTPQGVQVMQPDLKSNMDRFIAKAVKSTEKSVNVFKIQYGQIYRYNMHK